MGMREKTQRRGESEKPSTTCSSTSAIVGKKKHKFKKKKKNEFTHQNLGSVEQEHVSQRGVLERVAEQPARGE